MKKVFVVLASLLVVVAFTSCKKDYTCTCKGGILPPSALVYEKTTRSTAKEQCDKLDAATKIVDASRSCSL